MSLAGLSIKRPVATVMVMISMMFLGIVAMFSMKSELLPNMNIPMVMITTSWKGAVPQDVESQITKKIEEKLSKVEGIKLIRSASSFGQSKVMIEFDYGVDINTKKGDVQKEVDNVRGELPGTSDTPLVNKVEVGAGNLSMVVGVSGSNMMEVTTFVNEFMKPRFERISGVGSVLISGAPDKQIQILLDSDKLSAYNLTPTELYDMIRVSSINMPLGVIRSGRKEIVARFIGEFNYLDEFKNMIIKSNGKTLRLGDVAEVSLTTEDMEDSGKLNGLNAVTIGIEKSSDGNTIDIVNGGKNALEEMQSYLPAGIKTQIIMDYSRDINSSISSVKSNAVTGLVLATVILFIFLKNVRATMLISLALPIAIMFTFVFLYSQGVTINVISLMGLSIGVGMLTDNSVVVIDNIYRHMTELKKSVMQASEDGTTEVTVPIIASALTTMVVFIPILFIPGVARELFRDLAYSIIFSNIAALIVSLTLMPMVASRFLKSSSKITEEGKFFKKIKTVYAGIIEWVLKNKLKTVSAVLAIFMTVMYAGISLTKTQFIPDRDFGKYAVILELPKGLNLKAAEEIAEKAVDIVKREPHTQSYVLMTKKSEIILNVDIGPKEERKISMFDIMNNLRPELSTISDIRLNIKPNFQGRAPMRDVEMRIMSDRLENAEAVVQKMYSRISKVPGIVDIKSGIEPGNTEARVILDREKLRSYGINPVDAGRTISYSFLGGNRTKGETVTVKTGTEEIDVLVRLSDKDRENINSLQSLNIRTATGSFVKISDVAKIVMAEGASELNKVDRVYSVFISANDGGIGLGAVQKEMIKAFEAVNPPRGVTYKWGGISQISGEAMTQLGIALGISIFLIYAILAAQFENFVLPLIIIGSVPLALIGVYTGLITAGQPFDVMVMVGIIMLAGTVVNNAIVLIDFIKLLRDKGMEINAAVKEACETRLRPILMTTMTTVCGMIPLALGFGEGSELYRGMSIAVIFGLSFSTMLTLIVIPVLYVLIIQLLERIGKVLKGSKSKSEIIIDMK